MGDAKDILAWLRRIEGKIDRAAEDSSEMKDVMDRIEVRVERIVKAADRDQAQ